MPYIGKAPSSGIRSRFIYTATAAQTTFTGADGTGKTLGYTDGEYVDVYLNGVLLDPADYTATSKTSVVLDSGATVNDIVEIVVYDTFSVFNGTFTGDLTVDGDTLFVDSTNNRVGVGTVSPDGKIHAFSGDASQTANTSANQLVAENSGNAGLSILSGSTSLGNIYFADSGSTTAGFIQYEHGNNNLRFGTDSSESMRLSGGNLLVGHTGSIFNNINATSTVGSSYSSNGEIFACSDQSSGVMFLNRKSTDGAIATFRKDGTTVGSIGTSAGHLFVGAGGDTNLLFNDTANSIYPWDTTANDVQDATVDLGASTARFKDLYLGGSVYLGGTGSANALDDYEEGTWTPTLPSAWATGITTYDAHYTKIGNLVHITMWVAVSGITGTFTANIGGLPFTAHSGYGNLGTALVYSNATTAITRTYLTQSSTAFNLLNNSANFSSASNTQVGASNIMANFTYRV